MNLDPDTLDHLTTKASTLAGLLSDMAALQRLTTYLDAHPDVTALSAYATALSAYATAAPTWPTGCPGRP